MTCYMPSTVIVDNKMGKKKSQLSESFHSTERRIEKTYNINM